jgi:hypothetical protein
VSLHVQCQLSPPAALPATAHHYHGTGRGQQYRHHHRRHRPPRLTTITTITTTTTTATTTWGARTDVSPSHRSRLFLLLVWPSAFDSLGRYTRLQTAESQIVVISSSLTTETEVLNQAVNQITVDNTQQYATTQSLQTNMTLMQEQIAELQTHQSATTQNVQANMTLLREQIVVLQNQSASTQNLQTNMTLMQEQIVLLQRQIQALTSSKSGSSSGPGGGAAESSGTQSSHAVGALVGSAIGGAVFVIALWIGSRWYYKRSQDVSQGPNSSRRGSRRGAYHTVRFASANINPDYEGDDMLLDPNKDDLPRDDSTGQGL